MPKWFLCPGTNQLASIEKSKAGRFNLHCPVCGYSFSWGPKHGAANLGKTLPVPWHEAPRGRVTMTGRARERRANG